MTGSNSKLLSRELATALTGRHIPIYILPFSYSEFLHARKMQHDKKSLDEYLKVGGFPELILSFVPNYLNTLLDSLILRDIVDRYKVRNSNNLQTLSNVIFESPASPFTLRSLQKMTGIKSPTTVHKFLNYLVEVYSILKLERFSIKQKERNGGYSKIYPIDVGYIEAKKKSLTLDTGKVLETFVAVELYKRCLEKNSELFYFKTKGGNEVDFIIRKNTQIVQVVQVCERLHKGNYKREIESALHAGKELDCKNVIVYVREMEVNVSEYEDRVRFVEVGSGQTL